MCEYMYARLQMHCAHSLPCTNTVYSHRPFTLRYHSLGQSLAERETLLDAAEEAGLDVADAAALLDSDDKMDEVAEALMMASTRYPVLTGVPYFGLVYGLFF